MVLPSSGTLGGCCQTLEPCEDIVRSWNPRMTLPNPDSQTAMVYSNFLRDFKTVTEYNSAIHQITSQLKLCGENVTENDKLEKTLSTFHASNVVLQQQYREKDFQKCSQLIACLLLAEQNNELLMKNHQSRPIGSSPFPEANVTFSERGRGRGRGRGRESQRGRYTPYNRRSFDINKMQSKPQHGDIAEKDKQGKRQIGSCNRCGIEGHWANTCRIAKHLADLYQASLQKNGKEVETNYVDNDDDPDDDLLDYDTTHLDIADFVVDPSNPQ
ncbi:uncharacterized protein LOC127251239 [Andrographis paniculata]|uniref:uncharacterized protein LOC127251239 n=1 Tax=Andrographis paniculata TaxID=175694 RepID=UPI0021E9AB7A|nr:uncharacterized protein LOC127251239 [Andrographis paniculata]